MNKTTKQQQQALEYFSTHAEDWRSKAAGLDAKVNIIEQRNGYVLEVAGEPPLPQSFLDVGCGSGELVCQMAKKGIDSTGVDYAPEMIDLSTKKARDEGLHNAEFVCSSIFDLEIQPGSYDLISANGFIEYVSVQEMNTFFDLVAQALSPNGSFVIGSRNRLFNLVTMNDYTLQEIDASAIELLVREAVQWTNAKNMLQVVQSECAPFQADDTEHANTGIEVTTRFQYTPFQLISLLQDRGFHAVEVYPVHIHGVTPSFVKNNQKVHASISNLLQLHARYNTQLLAHASTFMLHVKRGE